MIEKMSNEVFKKNQGELNTSARHKEEKGAVGRAYPEGEGLLTSAFKGSVAVGKKGGRLKLVADNKCGVSNKVMKSEAWYR